MTAPIQPKARCFFCDSILEDDQARLTIPGGKIFGACCADIVHRDATGS